MGMRCRSVAAIVVMIAVLAVIAPQAARADDGDSGRWTPIGLALFDPIGLRGSTDVITGISANLIYGKSRHFYAR